MNDVDIGKMVSVTFVLRSSTM